MNRLYISIAKLLKNNWLFLFLILFVLGLLIILLRVGSLQNHLDLNDSAHWIWNKEVISALLGAGVVATITFALLKGQANTQSQIEQNKRVFQKKLEVYERFLSMLEDIIIKKEVSEEDERKLQFGVTTIGMHTSSDDMLVISKSLKHIIEKIRTPERVEGAVWNELMEIMNVFHHALYSLEKRELDVNMRKALRNFSTLCQDPDYKVLEFVDCMIASYNFNTFINDRCLFIEIPVKRSKINRANLPSKIYLTLQTEKKTRKEGEELFTGLIALYCNNDNKEKIELVYQNPYYWIAPQKIELNPVYGLMLGVNKIDYARVFKYQERTKMQLQEIVCDFINFICPVWADENQAILRKDKDGRIKKEIPLKRLKEEKIIDIKDIKKHDHAGKT